MHPDWQDKLHLYCEQNSSPEQQYLWDVTAFTWRNMLNARQLSGKLQGQLLSMLVALKNPQCILEIGTFTGYATACLTENASQDTQIHTIEADLETAFKNFHRTQKKSNYSLKDKKGRLKGLPNFKKKGKGKLHLLETRKKTKLDALTQSKTS
jgi:predicted O-methyltransferase YrrM